MDRKLRCECGFEVVGTEDDVVLAAQAHAWRNHGMELSTQMARSLSRPREAPVRGEGGPDQ
jgi:hypothetical protein